MQNLSSWSAFLSSGDNISLSPLQVHLLDGWKPSTLASYNSAVKRFIAVYEASHQSPFSLPASDDDIYSFCLSIGRTRTDSDDNAVTSKTVAKYLHGLQAWHLFHQKPYPSTSKNIVNVMLRASALADASTPVRPKKPAVMIHHLLALYNGLDKEDPKDSAVLDCAICAFWGMARLAELTYAHADGKPDRLISVLGEDAIRPARHFNHVILAVRGSKTAQPGVPQPILLNRQPNRLCPVQAVLRRLRSTDSPTDSLFGYNGPSGTRVNLTRSVVVSRCQQVWRTHGWSSISGHSFRVGGASLRAALGVHHDDIKTLGRWASDCYKLYIRSYSEEDLTMTKSVLLALNRQ